MMNEMGSPGSKTTSDDRRTSVAAISNAPLQREVVDLKTKLAEAEKRAERDIKALNQEVRFFGDRRDAAQTDLAD